MRGVGCGCEGGDILGMGVGGWVGDWGGWVVGGMERRGEGEGMERGRDGKGGGG